MVKSKLEKISDFDNTKAELSAKITLKEKELSELNAQISEKRAKIAELDANIAQKAPPENILPPGKYIIGKNIAAGKYTVTGTGKFLKEKLPDIKIVGVEPAASPATT